jgi:hypothetical protein
VLRKVFLFLWVALSLSFPSGIAYAQDSGDAIPGDTRSYGAVNCRIEKPNAWNNRRVTWIGECKTGHADGFGALQSAIEGLPLEVFLGRVSEGFLRNGVLVMKEGYTAGLWRDGKVVENSANDQVSRNVTLAAFEDAAKAADATSRLMARQSNSKASRFYSQLARRLRRQMD